MSIHEEEINDYYTILGCSVDATFEEIKRSYHKLALQYHPDKNNVEQSAKMFQRIEEAWRILSNQQLRKEYDTQLKQTNLENMSVLLYSRIGLNDLEASQDDDDLLVYTCRCGGIYQIHKNDLQESNAIIHVPCQECTLSIEINT